MFPAYATLRKRSLGDFVFGAVGLRLVHWGSLGAWWHRRATPRLGRASVAPGRAGTPQSAAWRPATGYEHTVNMQ